MMIRVAIQSESCAYGELGASLLWVDKLLPTHFGLLYWEKHNLNTLRACPVMRWISK